MEIDIGINKADLAKNRGEPAQVARGHLYLYDPIIFTGM
jgi:hypothetical protein